MPLDMTQFHQIFFEETAEHLSTMESLLLHLDPRDPDPELLDDLSRAAHSIKGSGGTFGFHDMAGPAQEIESLIAGVRKGGSRFSGETLDALHEACGALRALLAGYRGEGAAPPDGAARSLPPPAPDGKVSAQATARGLAAAAGEWREAAGRAAAATNEVMALVEAAGAGGLGDVTEAVRGLGEAIEQNAALAGRAADNAEMLRESFRDLVLAIAALALSPPGGRPASRLARTRPLPKVRRATGQAGKDETWPEF